MILGALAIVLAVAVGVAFIIRANDTSPARTGAGSTSEPNPGERPAPESARLPFSQRGLGAAGLAADGWSQKTVSFRLAGGPSAELLIRGSNPVAQGQSVAVTVNGDAMYDEPLPGGSFDLRLLAPSSNTNRTITLRFARATRLKPPDERSAAARLTSVAVRKLASAPRTVTFPRDVTNPRVAVTGLTPDGWVGHGMSLALAGGRTAAIVIRGLVAQVPPGQSQAMRVLVDGNVIADETVPPGALDLRVPVGPSVGVRDVEVHFSVVTRLSSADPRRLAARVTSVGLADLAAPSRLTIPRDLIRRFATYTGIYADGWAQRDVRLVLRGGGTAVLELDAENPLQDERLAIFVDGEHVVTTTLSPGAETVRVPLAPHAGPRLVELHFGRVARISSADERIASVLLRQAAVLPMSANALGHVVIPRDLSEVVYSGIYRDGWTQNDVRVVIAGGGATTLTVKAQTHVKGQRMTVVVDGRRLGAAKMHAGRDLVRVGLRASTRPRLVELRFSRLGRIASDDPRLASTLLQSVDLKRFAHTGRTSASPSFHAVLSMAAEVPPLTGNAAGTFTASLSGAALHWRLDMHGLSGPIIAAVIHVGGAGEVGPTLADLCRPCSDAPSGTLQLSAAGAAAIRDGRAYVNVGTPQHRFGEIRGPILTG